MSKDYVHIVVACDSETIKLFINGELAKTVAVGDPITIEYWAVPGE